MIISKIQWASVPSISFYNPNSNQKLTLSRYFSQPEHDVFIKSKSENSVNFLGGMSNVERSFETLFPKTFFRKLAEEHLPCAYTGIEMIPRSEYDNLITLQVLKKKSSVALKALKPYEQSMFETEKSVFRILESEAKKHPDLKLQELLQLKYSNAEKSLIVQQSKILNKINLMLRNLPKMEYLNARKIIQSYFDKIFAKDPLPEERFRRKDFIYSMRNLKLSDEKMQKKILETAAKLPTSETSINAFIVKYSQPYKVKYDHGEVKQIPRDSEEIGLRLIAPSLATDEHIYPRTLYNAEEAARKNGDANAQNLSKMRVTILTSKYINEFKDDMLFDDFIKKAKIDVPANIQNQINKLISTTEKWLDSGRIKDASLLADYIQLLKEEFSRRSNIVKIDISDFELKIPAIKEAAEKHNEKMKLKRLKKAGHADNSHKEHYVGSDGKLFENRKVQKHPSRYSG